VIKGKDIFVFCNPDNSHLAFSAASVNLCKACLSLLRSISCLARNFSAIQSTIFESKLFPPNCVSPQVALTSNTPLEIFNKELNGKNQTNISRLKNYCKAEEYHQKYLEKNR